MVTRTQVLGGGGKKERKKERRAAEGRVFSKQAAHVIGQLRKTQSHPQHQAPEKRKYTQGYTAKRPQPKRMSVATFGKVF